MALVTNRAPGDTVFAADVNTIAAAVNLLLGDNNLLKLAAVAAGATITLDYATADGFAAANAFPSARPSARTDVHFVLKGPASAFVAGQSPLSWMLSGDETHEE